MQPHVANTSRSARLLDGVFLELSSPTAQRATFDLRTCSVRSCYVPPLTLRALSPNSRTLCFSSRRKLNFMPDLWYRFLSQLCARFYFSRLDILPARPTLSGPTLLVALHRNGAVDGWVYKSIFPSAIFMIATQLQKNFLARLFFAGISVVREKDQTQGDHASNAEAMNRCYELLASGGTLAIFPEGTSSLGPRHLPFKSGAARIALEAAARQIPLTIFPLGITYDAPSTFRSNVQVIAGAPFSPGSFTLPELKHKIASCLEVVGVNVDSDEHYRDIRALASFASPDVPFHLALKAFENAIPPQLHAPWLTFRDSLAAHNLLHPEKSPFSPRSPILTSLAALVLSPCVLVAAILNAAPLLAANMAGRKFPDGPNVITLWRILIGAILFFLWTLLLFEFSLFTKSPLLFLAYLAVSLVGLLAYAAWKRHLRHALNAFRVPSLRRDYLAFRSTLLQELRSHAS